MYQESDDRIKGSPLKDTILVILLIAAFFVIGFIATGIRASVESNLPIYLFAALCAGCVYLIYRLRILGYRYTVFYEQPQPEYDARFDDYIVHEDYPYPVGTFVAERTTSAKGTIIDVIKANEIIAVLKPGEDYENSAEEIVCCSHGKAKAHSIVYGRDGSVFRMYISPSEELLGYIDRIMREKE
ncbi:MAG: hypothetical protein J5827_00895 [Oscillospiraceae bacterium]|nr:hypothetical protein [Oscillospiraceae bacterium]